MHNVSGLYKLRHMKANTLPRRDKLKQAIWFSGMSQKIVADKAGMTAPDLSEIVHGKRNVTPDEAQRIAGVLGSTVRKLGLQ